MDPWNIIKIPIGIPVYDQLPDDRNIYVRYRHRVYGWGYLTYVGVAALVSGIAGFVIDFGVKEDVLAAVCFAGFMLIWVGIFLAGHSERKAMELVDAKCLEIQVNHLGPLMRRPQEWAVRALMEYRLDGKSYQATPMPQGYALFMTEVEAEAFSRYLQQQTQIKLYVDKKLPRRTLFHTLHSAA